MSEEQQLALGVDPAPLVGLADPGAADLETSVFGADLQVARDPDRLARRGEDGGEDQGGGFAHRPSEPLLERLVAPVARPLEDPLVDLRVGVPPQVEGMVRRQRFEADGPAFQEHRFDFHGAGVYTDHVSPTGRTRFNPPSTRASASGFPSSVEFRTMDRGAP